MKLKYTCFALALFTVLTSFYACTKTGAKEASCEHIACAMALPIISIDFVDKQGRDMLSTATPNYFDSLKIMQLNTGLVQIARPGLMPPNINRHKMILNWKPGDNTLYLKLSDTDQDTITYTQKIIPGCCINYELTAFSYNGKAYTDSVSRKYFTIVK
jgi:hypothetical protein